MQLTTYPQAGAWSRRKAQYRWRVMLAGLAAFAAIALTIATLPVFAEGESTGSMNFSGASGTYLMAESASHGSGDLTVRFYAAADDWTSGTQTVLARWPGASADNALRVQFTGAGHLQLLVKDAAGTDRVFTGSHGRLSLNDGKGKWFQITVNLNNGSGSSVGRFWVSDDAVSTPVASVEWGSAADSDTEPAIGGLTSSSGAWEIGSRKLGTADAFRGAVSALQLTRDGGTKAIDLDFRSTAQANSTRTKWTDGTGTVWSAIGSGWTYDEPEEASTTTTTAAPPTTAVPPQDPDDGSDDVSQLNPGTPANDDAGAMVLPGSSGNYVGGQSFSNGTGDIEVFFRAAADDWSAGRTQTILARWSGTSASTNVLRVQLKSDGSLQFLVKSSGGDRAYTITAGQLGGLADGKAYWFRLKFNSQTANGSNVRFWVSGTSASANPTTIAWGSPVRDRRSSAVTPIDGTGTWEIGSRNGGSRDLFDGKVMYAAVYVNGWSDSGGATAMQLDMRDTDQASSDLRTWSDGAGRTWTVRGSGAGYVGGGATPPPANGNPIAGSDSLSTTKDESATFTKSQLMSNDSDPDGDSLTVASIAVASNRGGSISGSGSTYSYEPPTGYVGSDSFIYTLSDSAGNTTIGTVGVTISDSPDVGQYDVVVRPGDDVQALINARSSGTSFYFKAGLYRRFSVQPKSGNTFVGESGAVLVGSKKLTDWSSDGGDWVATGQTQGSSSPSQGDEWGRCDDGYGGCVYPEEMFIDGVRQWRVTSRSAVTPGKWYFDYGADKIYIGTNPSGKSVETSVEKSAFWGSADNVTISGFTIQMYANPGRQGAINPRIGRAGAAGTGWVVTDNTIRSNHGWGIKSETNMVVKNNYLGDNGQGGFGGTGNNILFQGNEVDHNCTAGFKCFGFEGGGLKLSTLHTTIRNNYVHDNLGHGIHTDIHSADILIEGNVVRGNQGAGIHHEISADAVIRNNVVEGNGFKPDGQREPGILILSSSDVEVYGNTLRGNGNSILARQDGRTGDGEVRNLWVHDNHMTLVGSERAGLSVSGTSSNSYFSSYNNRFDYNTYVLGGSSTSAPFNWNRTTLTPSQWRSAGHDTHGTFQ